MVSSVIISPNSGFINSTTNIKFSLSNLSNSNGLRIQIENVIDLKVIETFELEQNINSIEKSIDLKVPEYFSQSMISIYVSIEEKIVGGTYKLREIVPVIFYIKEKVEFSFDGTINISPSFIGNNDNSAIFVNSTSEKRVIFSINDKKFNVMINESGIGSIHFKGRDVLQEDDISVVQKIPVYFYSSFDGYTKKHFTGFYLNIIPQKILTYATYGVEEVSPLGEDPRCEDYNPATWEAPSWCFSIPDPEYPDPFIPIIPPHEFPVKKCEEDDCSCNSDENKILIDTDICGINGMSSTLLQNGMILHAYYGVDSTIEEDDDGYNINKIFIVKSESSLENNLITAARVVILPKEMTDDITIYVEKEIYDRIVTLRNRNKGVVAVIFDEDMLYNAYPVIEAYPISDEYNQFYTIILSRQETAFPITLWKYCAYTLFYTPGTTEDVLPNINSPLELPFINVEENNENIVSVINVSISSNINDIDSNGVSYVYVIAEAIVDRKIQLFYYAFSVSSDSDFELTQVEKWKQLTFEGNNKNAKIVIDNLNNLHIFWESDRTGSNQIYYGVLGPSVISIGNSVLSSVLNKQKNALLNNDSFDYLKTDILLSNNENLDSVNNSYYDEYTGECFFSDSGILDNNWLKNITHNGIVSVEDNNTFSISSQTCQDTSMFFIPLNKDNRFDIANTTCSQINYQISFDFNADITQNEVEFTESLSTFVENNDFDSLYIEWKNQFTISEDSNLSNTVVYYFNDNKFTIGKEDSVYDRFIPIVGSYKNNNLSNYNINDTVLDSFKVIISGDDKNIRHFVLGIMPEKIIFKASNIETKLEYCDRNDISIIDAEGYVSEKKDEIYTGNAYLVLLHSQDDNIREELVSYKIIQKISDPFILSDINNIKILVNYSKLFYEDVGNYLDINKDLAINYPRFISNISVLFNSIHEFSTSFVSDLSDGYNEFDIGFGIPSEGSLTSDTNLIPYNMSVFENVNITMNYSEVILSSPTYIINSNIANIPSYVREQNNFAAEDVYYSGENSLSKFSDYYNRFYSLLDIDERPVKIESDIIETETDVSGYCVVDREESSYFTTDDFMQIPITVEGENTNISLDLGSLNDIHIVWQSNRYKQWDIFYSNSLDKNNILRFDNRITNSEGNSLSPSVAINDDGKRMIVWHDNRDGKYNIYGAKANESIVSSNEICQNNGLLNYGDISFSQYSQISFDFENTCDDNLKFHFKLLVYSDANYQNLIKIISSYEDVSNWEINGNSFPSDGAFITDRSRIVYSVPPLDDICGQVVYIKNIILDATDGSIIEPEVFTDRIDEYLEVSGGGTGEADIIILIDESNSMAAQQQWLRETIIQIDSDLQNKGISPRYSVVGYAIYDKCPDTPLNTHPFDARLNGHIHPIDGEQWSDNAGLVSDCIENTIKTSVCGAYADVYESIDFIFNRAGYSFRENAVKCLLVLTDTCRELVTTTQDAYFVSTAYNYSDIQNTLINNDVLLFFIGNVIFDEADSFLGVNSNQEVYVVGDDGEYSVETYSPEINYPKEGTVTAHCGGISILNSYYKLTHSVGGVFWNINVLDGTPGYTDARESFNSAFSDMFGEAINNIVVITTYTNCSYSIYPEKDSFYCSGSTSFNTFSLSVPPVISFSFKDNELIDEPIDEYGLINFHFRINFYTNESKTTLLYSSFSLLNSKRWFYKKDGGYYSLSSDGIYISPEDIIDIIYVPEILPQQKTEQQYEKEVPLTDFSLLCGVKYYIDIDCYGVSSSKMHSITSRLFSVDCQDVDTNLLLENKDSNNWICSGTGKMDILVAESGDQSLFPEVKANKFDYFHLVWQSKRGNSYKNINGLWNSENDILYSSGQGYYEHNYPNKGMRPNVIVDQAQNFYIYSNDKDSIYFYNCSLPQEGVATVDDDDDNETTSTVCFPGSDIDSSVLIDDFKIRVYEEDKKGSLIINKDKVVEVVDKEDFRLDINGIYGAYAVRLRNSDGDWSGWIGIDNGFETPVYTSSIASSSMEFDSTFKAYFINNNRFIVPWKISKINGLKRICCQILTFYGITNIICKDILVNIDVLSYDVEFYTDKDKTKKVAFYDGYQLLRDSYGTGTSIYLKVIFNELQSYSTGQLKFDFVHQGINDQYNLSLTPSGTVPTDTYEGKITIYSDDGVFYKDGLGFIRVIFPEETISSCDSDKSDPFNLMLKESDLKYYEDSDPEKIFTQYKIENVSKILKIDEFKQYYNKNDSNFLFGNDKFFRD